MHIIVVRIRIIVYPPWEDCALIPMNDTRGMVRGWSFRGNLRSEPASSLLCAHSHSEG
jgi:hypothetical protein